MDARDVRDTCDAIVSIEMLKAFGAESFATFFQARDATDYVRTLGARRPQSMEQAGTVRAMSVDGRFVRLRACYLAPSETGFATGIGQDLQLVFEKRRGIA